jgi:hypothetical protein
VNHQIALALIVIGLIGLLLREHKHSDSVLTPAPAPPSPAALPGPSAPSISIVNKLENIGNSTQQQSQASAAAPAIARVPRPEPRYNFDISPPYFVSLMEEENSYIRMAMPQYSRGFGTLQPALVVEITNRAHREFAVSYASDVVAELDKDGTKIAGPLVWEGEAGSEVNFSPDSPQTLILAMGQSTYSDQWFLPRHSYSRTERGYRKFGDDRVLPQSIDEELTLNLCSKGRVIFSAPFRLSRIDKKISVTFKPQQQ